LPEAALDDIINIIKLFWKGILIINEMPSLSS